MWFWVSEDEANTDYDYDIMITTMIEYLLEASPLPTVVKDP